MSLDEHKKIGISIASILGVIVGIVGFYSDIKDIFSKDSDKTQEVVVTSIVTLENTETITTYKESKNIDNTIDDFTQHTYQIFNNCSTWEQAKEYCESLGGHLATISSQQENDYLYQLMLSSGLKSVYFGLSDNENEGIFKWVNDEQIIYSNWHQGEPNSENSHEDYGMFYYKFDDGTWNDGDFEYDGTANDTVAFICEWDYKLE